MMTKFLSCDWGTSSFRLRLINMEDCSVMAECTNSRGIASVYNEWKRTALNENEKIGFYQNILLDGIKKLYGSLSTQLPVIISGMASSSLGIVELPYSAVPFDINDSKLNIQRIQADKKFPHEMFIVSGLKTDNDVMRGEETMLLAADTNVDAQLVIFQGTHSKHVQLEKNIIMNFKTFMTGELFDLLANKSILSASVENSEPDELSHESFIRGVHDAASKNFLNSIFHVRTNQLFSKLNKYKNYYYLSGLLIGEELKDIAPENFSQVTIVGTGILTDLYKKALSVKGLGAILKKQNAEIALIKGQIHILTHYQ